VEASYSSGPRCQSVCHMRISPKLSEIDVWLLGNLNRNVGFPIQSLPSDSRLEVRSAIMGNYGLALCPLREKWANWASECSERIGRNRH